MGESPVRSRYSLTNFTRTPLAGQALLQGANVIEVPREPVSAVNHDRVPVTGEAQQLRELRHGRTPFRKPCP
jgi:hypothetical protein